MKKSFLLIVSLVMFSAVFFAQEIKPLYQLPEKNVSTIPDLKENNSDLFLAGSDLGLFLIGKNNKITPLWEDGRVDQIQPVVFALDSEKSTSGWFMKTSKGLFFTTDFKDFEERNSGLSFLTIKKYDGKKSTLEKQIQELKDFSVNPINNLEMVTATKDAVYISKDGGKNWKNIKSMSRNTSGMKAVAIATIQNETVVFMSHPTYGFSYILPDRQKSEWTDVSSGFEIMKSLTSTDEISDILPVYFKDEEGNLQTEIFISQGYLPRIYRFNWTAKKAELLYKDDKPVNAFDGLGYIDGTLYFTKLENLESLDLTTLTTKGAPTKLKEWEKGFNNVPGMINTAWIPKSKSGFSTGLILNELWELYPGSVNTPYAEIADGKKSIYASAYQCRLQSGIDKYKKLLKDRNMNSLVIDMKDDQGLLRYDTNDPLVKEKGSVTQYKIDLDHFVSEFKKDNTYLIARIVTFKDKSLSKYGKEKYAVVDSKTGKAWRGIKGTETVINEEDGTESTVTSYYDEYWVDPYCQEVWEYNVAIAKELIARGFDEIQFDYIRFPTDGKNLYNAKYRWRDEGMDKESALISFLSYARENIDAPIGIDIYGANGWYRSGTRTGQDAEMLAEYVDVIGPMFYPSHFEQTFLNYEPVADRTYRIYYYGSFRNTVLCRNRAIVRPWVQSFFLNVSYDRAYYNSSYIEKQFFGTRDSINRGYMCWNNSGDYSTTPPDVADDAQFTGTAPESKFEKPAIGTRKRPMPTAISNIKSVDISILDSVRQQGVADNHKDSQSLLYVPFMQIPLVNVYANQ